MISGALALQVLRGGSPSSLPPSVSLSLAQGETASYAVAVTRSDTGAAENLTGGQLQFAASRRAGSTPVISRQLTITTAASGLATLELASDDTASLSVGAYVCDVWYTDSGGNRYPVTGLSALVLRPGIVTEGLAVTVLPSQTPLAQGERGPGADGVAVGDLQIFDGVDWQPFTVGSDGQVLTVDTAQPLKQKWTTPAAGISPASTVEDVASTGSAGAASTYARGDHVHAYHAPNCLYFPLNGPTHVDFGSVYPANTQLGQSFVEGWIRWDSGQYFISDGYGGGHAWLVGVDPITRVLTGNFWDNASGQSFSSEDQVAAGEWFHFAVGYNGVAIEVYINGVPSGRKAYTGQRWSTASGWYIGGSDHQNFYGAVAWMRLFEGYCPTTRAAFRPDRHFGTKFGLVDAYGSIKWAADFTRPAGVIADLGVTGGHPGRLCNANPLDAVSLPLYKEPIPYWTYDPSCPVGYPAADSLNWGAEALIPPATPSGARIFDSFSRRDQTLAIEAANFVGLGSTETGTLGPVAWSDPSGAFGIFKGRAFIRTLAQRVKAWVENGTADMDVSVDRRVGSTGDTGLVLRLIDANNYIKVWYHNSVPLGNGGDGNIRVSAVVDGVVTDIINVTPTSGFTTLRCRVKTVAGVSTYTVWTDGVQLGTGTTEANAAGTKAGIYAEWYTSSVYANGHGRWDNFTIYATP